MSKKDVLTGPNVYVGVGGAQLTVVKSCIACGGIFLRWGKREKKKRRERKKKKRREKVCDIPDEVRHQTDLFRNSFRTLFHNEDALNVLSTYQFDKLR